jgi:hypothetical protein
MRKLRAYRCKMSTVRLKMNLKDADSVGKQMLMNQIPSSHPVSVLAQSVSSISIVSETG